MYLLLGVLQKTWVIPIEPTIVFHDNGLTRTVFCKFMVNLQFLPFASFITGTVYIIFGCFSQCGLKIFN